ncbi:MAG: hypothetical protein ACRYGP_13765 [Janthinobacterium lividum]
MSASDKLSSRHQSRDPGCLHCKLNAVIDDHYAQQGMSLSADAVLDRPDSLKALARVTAELLSADHLWLSRIARLFRFAVSVQADMAEVDRLRARQMLIAGGAHDLR